MGEFEKKVEEFGEENPPLNKKEVISLKKFLELKSGATLELSMFNYWYLNIKGTADFEKLLYYELYKHNIIKHYLTTSSKKDIEVSKFSININVGKQDLPFPTFIKLGFTSDDPSKRLALSQSALVKNKEIFSILRVKANLEADTKEGLKLFTKAGKTILALVKNGIDEKLMKALGCFQFKYELNDGYYCVIMNPKKKHVNWLKKFIKHFFEEIGKF